jgi:Right handed beta helix region
LPAPLAPSTGAALYVAPDGLDSNPGTLALPFQTVAQGLSVLEPGQKLFLRAGTYAEWVKLERSGTAADPISVRSYPGESVQMTGRLKITASYVRVSGLRFVGRTEANLTDVLIYVSGGDHVEISNNELTGAAMSAIYVGDPGNGGDDVQFLSNWVHDNGTRDNLDHGIYYGTGTGGVIANNLFERNHAYGVHLYPDCDAAVVTQNTIVGHGRSGVLAGGELLTSDSNVVVNNIVAFNTGHGVRSYWGGVPGTGNLFRNNLAFGNAAGDLGIDALAAGWTFVDTTIADPLFADRPANDYRLAEASPALDRALAEFSPAQDLDGRARPQGPAAELGAYER